MDKRTILAIALSLGIFIIYFVLTNVFFKPEETQTVSPQETEIPEEDIKETETVDFRSVVPVEIEDDKIVPQDNLADIKVSEYTVTFSQKGAVITHLKLNEYLDLDDNPKDDIDPEPIEMVISDGNKYPFTIYFGNYTTSRHYDTSKDMFYFDKEKSSETEYWFSKEYKSNDEENPVYFTLTKIFSFKDPYIIDLKIMLECKDRNLNLPLNLNDSIYTLTFGPQFGPRVEKIDDQNIEIRRYFYYTAKGKENLSNKVKNKKRVMIDKYISWAGIEGKYFAVIADPPIDVSENQVGFDTTDIPGLYARSSMFFIRPYEKSGALEEEFKFYIGPKIKKILNNYSKNDFQKMISENFFSWIVILLRGLLEFLYKLVGNWGVAIILMTIIIKLLFFPLTQKGFKSTAKMQALNPKIEEIKAKYKDDAQKMQGEIAALYKAHNINPLAGCLPWLIQIPIFIGLFTMLRNQFDLRGAVFIPGWINDLSSPENFIKLPFFIPVVNWNYINTLPFAMTAMMFVQQRFTQSPNAASGQNQMKILMYAMPIMFFFICYNMPSGLVLYWTMQSLISLLQQILINTMQKKKKDGNIPPQMNENIIKKKKKRK